jgi:hypothetical protein
MAMLQGLDLGANFSNLPDCRKKLIPYNSKVKMHKPSILADSFSARRQGLLECARSTSP